MIKSKGYSERLPTQAELQAELQAKVQVKNALACLTGARVSRVPQGSWPHGSILSLSFASTLFNPLLHTSNEASTLCAHLGISKRYQSSTWAIRGLINTPPWRIRLKARVDLGDQTAQFYTFTVISTTILTYFNVFLGINPA